MKKSVIRFEAVNFGYDGSSILENINLEISEGERIVIIGPSGCGKSTLLKLILGFEQANSGFIQVLGKQISPLEMDDYVLSAEDIGILFQSAALFDFLNVEENILFPLRDENNALPFAAQDKLKKVVEDLEIEAHLKKEASELSGGQRKRVGLARAMISQPKIMLYDEPTTGLDPVLSTVIEDCINKMNEVSGVTSIVVSHQPSTILRTADRVILLDQKTIQETAEIREIKASSSSRIKDFIEGVSRERR